MYLAESLDKSISLVREREDNYQEYFESAKIGIVYLDEAMRVKNLNHESEQICGVDRAKAIGRKAELVFGHCGENFSRIFNIDEDIYTVNLKLKIKGKTKYVHVDMLKLKGSLGEIGGVILIMQDLSAVKNNMKQIQTTHLLMSLGELAAGVAHHVRTPLTTINGYLQVMLKRLENDHYAVRREVVETLLDEVSYINNVVKELVLFAKPPIKKEPWISANRIIEESLLLVFKEMGGEKIVIDKQIDINLPFINADGNLLKQAVMNIMQNALESMSDEGVLTVKSWLHGELNMLVISISDTGCGIAPEVLPRVFEPFYTTKLERIGLGLPTAHRIITEHSGFVNISGNENFGTKVHIYLPIIDDCASHITAVHQQILNLQ